MACYFNDKKVLPLADFSQTDSFDSRRTANGEKILSPSFALVEKIKGKTVKSTNLIPFPYYDPTDDSSGLDYKSNSDGSITINGTMTRVASAYVFAKYLDLKVGKTYTYSIVFSKSVNMLGNVQVYNNGSFVRNVVNTQGGRLATFTVTEDMVSNGNYIQLNLYSANGIGTVFTDVVAYPMLNEGSTALPYAPYFAGLKNATISGIKSTGANLIPFPYADGGAGTSVAKNGITYTVNEDRSLTLNGQNNGIGNSVFFLSSNLVLSAGTYIANLNTEISGISMVGYDGTNYINPIKGVTFSNKTKLETLYIQVQKGNTTVFNNVTVYPMLNYGSTAQPYQPYTENTYQLPESYELGEWDSINPIEKTITRGTKYITFTGNEYWFLFQTATSDIYRMAVGIELSTGSADDKNVVSNFYMSCSANETYYKKIGISCYKGILHIFDDKYNDVAVWKAHLAELANSGNPLTVAYELQTPTTETVEDLPRGYTAHKDGTETYLAGETDNSEWGAIPEFTLNYPKIMKEGTFNG